MKLVEELKGFSDESIIAVFTGNGRTELHILVPLAQKYNGNKKVLFLPKPPIHLRPDVGLSALKALKTYLDKYRIAHTLFLVDKEHFDQKEVDKEIDGALRSFGIDVQNIESPEKLWENALIINGLVGHREVIIHAVVLGKKKCLEEDIAKLVELELGIKVEPSKKVIRTLLHKHGLDICTLVEKAHKKTITRAFPALTFILKEIEKNNIE